MMTYLPVVHFHVIIGYVRLYAHERADMGLRSPILRQRYILQNTTGEVMWSCNVTTIEHDGERCKSSVSGK